MLSQDMNAFDVKCDWVISSNDRLAVRYSYQKANVFDPGLYGPEGGIYGGPHGGGFSGRGPARTQSPGLTYSKVISPTFVWESRFGAIRNRNDALNQDYGHADLRNASLSLRGAVLRGANMSGAKLDGAD